MIVSVPCDAGYRLAEVKAFVAACERAGLDDEAEVSGRLMGWHDRIRVLSAECPDVARTPGFIPPQRA